jgi:hypothetical protein
MSAGDRRFKKFLEPFISGLSQGAGKSVGPGSAAARGGHRFRSGQVGCFERVSKPPAIWGMSRMAGGLFLHVDACIRPLERNPATCHLFSLNNGQEAFP